jgi:predicted DNA-binding protein with PD1-like motif
MEQLPSGLLRAHAIRLTPGKDLGPALEDVAAKAMRLSHASSALVLSAVGSLDTLTLRMANASKTGDTDGDKGNENRSFEERLEIVSLVGTFSSTGKHLHMSVSDSKGQTFGGHFISGRIFTTVELVLGTIDNVEFKREIDDKTGYKELVVTQKRTSEIEAKRRRTDDSDDAHKYNF